jgi:hypothetical protein
MPISQIVTNSIANGAVAPADLSTGAPVWDTSGNVGIGATSNRASSKLDIRGDVMTLGSNALYYATIDYNAGNGFLSLASETGGGMAFKSGTTERARINSNGNLLVGATSDSNSMRFVVANTNNSRTWGFGTSGSGTNFWVLDNTTGSGVYITAGGTSWTGTSDERFKTDLIPITNAAEKVNTLRAVTGRFKTDEEGTSRAFLIAQDVQAVLPEAVDASNPDKLGVAYTDVIPLLVAAIQELKAELDTVKTELAALKG